MREWITMSTHFKKRILASVAGIVAVGTVGAGLAPSAHAGVKVENPTYDSCVETWSLQNQLGVKLGVVYVRIARIEAMIEARELAGKPASEHLEAWLHEATVRKSKIVARIMRIGAEVTICNDLYPA
jgi:hypothetical protein